MRPEASYLSSGASWLVIITGSVRPFSQMRGSSSYSRGFFCSAMLVCSRWDSGNNADSDSLSDRPEHAQPWWVYRGTSHCFKSKSKCQNPHVSVGVCWLIVLESPVASSTYFGARAGQRYRRSSILSHKRPHQLLLYRLPTSIFCPVLLLVRPLRDAKPLKFSRSTDRKYIHTKWKLPEVNAAGLTRQRSVLSLWTRGFLRGFVPQECP